MNIREKIQKIIDKAKSTTSEAEADSLLAMAQSLMEKHQIEAFELGDNSDPVGMTVGLTGQSGPSAYKPLVQRALAKYYGAFTIRCWNDNTNYRIEIVGPESARITTELMTEYVWDQVKAEAKRLADVGEGKRDALIRKIANALAARIAMLTAEQERAARGDNKTRTVTATKNALVIKDATDAWVAQHYPNMKMTSGKGRSTTNAARNAAAGININRQVGGGRQLRIGA